MAIIRVVQDLLGRIGRSTGKMYPALEKELEVLTPVAQQEFVRLLIDLEFEKSAAPATSVTI